MLFFLRTPAVSMATKGSPLATLYESRTGLYFLDRWLPYQRVIGGHDRWVRRFTMRANRPDKGKTFVNERIHRSAVDRFGELAKFRARPGQTNEAEDGQTEQRRYEPENLHAALDADTLPIVGYDGTV